MLHRQGGVSAAVASKKDQFYLGLKKSYKESWRYLYLYDTGAPFYAILRAARKAEAEVEHFKDTDPAPTKAAQAQGMSPELMSELVAIKAVARLTAEESKARQTGRWQKEWRWQVQQVAKKEVSRRPLLWLWWNWSLHKGLS